jgi:hypothetical protein
MKIIYLKKTKEYYPLRFPNEISNKKFTYFKTGIGYKTTKVFEIFSEELPDRPSKLSWLTIAKIVDKYGLEVGDVYSGNKVAEIISYSKINSNNQLFQQIKELFE